MQESKEVIAKVPENAELPQSAIYEATLKMAKPIARITLCGSINFTIYDNMNFIKPTPEQIKNLKEMLCIDVELPEEGADNGKTKSET